MVALIKMTGGNAKLSFSISSVILVWGESCFVIVAEHVLKTGRKNYFWQDEEVDLTRGLTSKNKAATQV